MDRHRAISPFQKTIEYLVFFGLAAVLLLIGPPLNTVGGIAVMGLIMAGFCTAGYLLCNISLFLYYTVRPDGLIPIGTFGKLSIGLFIGNVFMLVATSTKLFQVYD